MKKYLTAFAVALAFGSAAQAASVFPAAGNPPNYVLQFAWTVDGTQIASASTIVLDSLGTIAPLGYASGSSVGYSECEKTSNGVRLVAHEKFIGRLIQVRISNSHSVAPVASRARS